MEFRKLGISAVLLLSIAFMHCQRQAAGKQEGGEPMVMPEFRIGDTVTMNAVGMGKVIEYTERDTKNGRMEKGYLLSLDSRKDQEAFVPFSRAASLLHAPVDEPTAKVMLTAILDARSLPPEADGKGRRRRSAELWQKGTHPEQAIYLGQLLVGASRDDVALIIGYGHLLYEISHVLRIPIEDLDSRIEHKFPWLKGAMPPR